MAHKGWIQPLCHPSTAQFMTGKRLRGIDTEDEFDMACACVIIGLAMGIFFLLRARSDQFARGSFDHFVGFRTHDTGQFNIDCWSFPQGMRIFERDFLENLARNPLDVRTKWPPNHIRIYRSNGWPKPDDPTKSMFRIWSITLLRNARQFSPCNSLGIC